MSTFSRLNRTPILNLGQQYGTCEAQNVIRQAIKNGTLKTKELVINEAQRLDTLAGTLFGDARLWWVLASSSLIGYALQVPPGTIILVPDLGDVQKLLM